MDEQNKDLNAPDVETEVPSEPHQDHVEKLKETTEKLWGSTRHALSSATFKANQYRKLVQKKIDQSALHKKINVAHADLGKMIDDLREAGQKNIMNLAEVKEILARIDVLKAEAASLVEEIEQIRVEEVPSEDIEEPDKTQ